MSQDDKAQISDSSPATTPSWGDTLWLPCRVSFGLKILGFTVGDLVQLELDSVVDSQQSRSQKVEVALNGRHIAWAEPEAAGDQLGFRLTGLA